MCIRDRPLLSQVDGKRRLRGAGHTQKHDVGLREILGVLPVVMSDSELQGANALEVVVVDQMCIRDSSRMVSKSPVSSGMTSSTAPKTTMPVVPSMEIMSPSRMTRSVPAMAASFLAASIFSASTPHTHGAPMPRAMTAAWLVLPPWEVRMPSACLLYTSRCV